MRRVSAAGARGVGARAPGFGAAGCWAVPPPAVGSAGRTRRRRGRRRVRGSRRTRAGSSAGTGQVGAARSAPVRGPPAVASGSASPPRRRPARASGGHVLLADCCRSRSWFTAPVVAALILPDRRRMKAARSAPIRLRRATSSTARCLVSLTQAADASLEPRVEGAEMSSATVPGAVSGHSDRTERPSRRAASHP